MPLWLAFPIQKDQNQNPKPTVCDWVNRKWKDPSMWAFVSITCFTLEGTKSHSPKSMKKKLNEECHTLAFALLWVQSTSRLHFHHRNTHKPTLPLCHTKYVLLFVSLFWLSDFFTSCILVLTQKKLQTSSSQIGNRIRMEEWESVWSESQGY